MDASQSSPLRSQFNSVSQDEGAPSSGINIEVKVLSSSGSAQNGPASLGSTQKLVSSSQSDIADRCMAWKEQREKRLQQAKEVKEKQVIQAENCTFQPNLSKPAKRRGQNTYTQQDFDMQIAMDNQKKGLDRYLQRMDKAKEMKEEKQRLEDHMFAREKKWRPKITTPQEPNLSAFRNKTDRDTNIKALNKPVDILGSTQEIKSSIKREENVQTDGHSGQGLKKTQDFINLTKKTKSQFVEIRPDMTYEDAITLIHQHILNLEI